MPSLKFASVNIERSKHLHRLEPFLRAYTPDVLCLQELYETDIPFFQNIIGPHFAYAPMTLYSGEKPTPTAIGVAIFSRAPLTHISINYYKGTGNPVPLYHSPTPINTPDERGDDSTIHHPLLAATTQDMRIATTHLMVTTQGESSPEQREDAARMVNLAKSEAGREGGLCLCGDFNAPRGRATFALIAESFTDCIPAHYTTSLDRSLHRAGHKLGPNLMVDGLFLTPTYKAENVTLHPGVSDHQALTADIFK